MARKKTSAPRLVDAVPATPRVKSPGLLGTNVIQDQHRPDFDRANALLKLGEVRPDAVLIGDSLTAGWKVEPLLAPWFPIVVNRGIGGDSAKWLGHRLEADALQLRPRHIVLMIGTNDISHRFGYDSNAKIVRDYKRHMAAILGRIAKARITGWIGTIPPVRQTMIDDVHNQRKQQCIPLMNAELRKLVKRLGLHLVDYYPEMLDGDGISLRADLATDSCHFNVRGQYLLYLVLRRALERAGE